MVNNLYRFIFTFVLVFSSLWVFAQTSETDNILRKEDKSLPLKFGVNYLNNSIFMGRSDTARMPIVTPNIRYTFKSGIYVAGSLDYLPDSKTAKITSGDLVAGYDHDFTDDLDGGLSFTKSFYNSRSTQIASSQSGSINVNLNYDLGDIITPSVSADYAFNKKGFKNDIFLNAGLSHAFIVTGLFSPHDLLIISPTAQINWGTQNFYDSYLVTKKFKNTKKTTTETLLIAAQRADLEKFKLLDYEFSIPVEYKINHFLFSFVPTYSVAQNKLPGNITSGLTNKTGLFNFEAGIALRF